MVTLFRFYQHEISVCRRLIRYTHIYRRHIVVLDSLQTETAILRASPVARVPLTFPIESTFDKRITREKRHLKMTVIPHPKVFVSLENVWIACVCALSVDQVMLVYHVRWPMQYQLNNI